MQFQKILSYGVYGNKSTNKYTHVCALLKQTIDPSSSQKGQLDADGKLVFISPRTRAISCLNVDTTTTVRVEPALNEIPFDLMRYCSAEEFADKGSTAVREAFLHLFVTNQLAISHKKLQTEFEHILALSHEYPDALAISHTFRLRLLQTYLKTDQDLFADPKQVYNHLDPTEHWLSFGDQIAMLP